MTNTDVLDQEMVEADNEDVKGDETAPEDDFVEADASADLTEDEEPVQEYASDEEVCVYASALAAYSLKTNAR